MKKEHRKTFILTCFIMLLPMIAGLLLWDRLPQQVATHFGSDGTANGWSSRTFAVFGLPLFLLGAHVLAILFTLADPKKANMNAKILALIMWLCPIISVYICITVYGNALGYEMNMSKWTTLMIGLLFVIIGNYLPKCKQNYTLGFKLSWTLEDEENWNKTHRLAGFLWIVGGLIIMLSAIWEMFEILMVVMLVITLVPIAYSFGYYLRHGANKERD